MSEYVKCSLCELGAVVKGFCRKHYRDDYRNSNRGPCLIPGCVRYKLTKGMCESHYGISIRHNIDSDQMIEFYSRNCEICKSTTSLHIDHDHDCCPGKGSCGKCIRSVLCGTCNRMLGNAGDNIAVLQSAIKYLEKSVT